MPTNSVGEAMSGTAVTESSLRWPSRPVIQSLPVGWSPLHQRDCRGHAFHQQGRTVKVFEAKQGCPALCVHCAGLGKRLPEDLLGRLVVEHEVAVRVGDERRRCELRGKLAREDQSEMLLWPAFHWSEP